MAVAIVAAMTATDFMLIVDIDVTTITVCDSRKLFFGRAQVVIVEQRSAEILNLEDRRLDAFVERRNCLSPVEHASAKRHKP